MKHQLFLILHLVAATIWVGGHLILAIRFLPQALKKKDASVLKNFKDKFEPVGLPALLVLVVTGIAMAYDYNVTFTQWFSFSNSIEKVVSIKLLLLFTTVILAVNAQLRVFPKLSSDSLLPVAIQIVAVTLLGVAMLVMGSWVRIGGL
jgi:putative copper export protein